MVMCIRSAHVTLEKDKNRLIDGEIEIGLCRTQKHELLFPGVDDTESSWIIFQIWK